MFANQSVLSDTKDKICFFAYYLTAHQHYNAISATDKLCRFYKRSSHKKARISEYATHIGI
jgi:hypothetical protein